MNLEFFIKLREMVSGGLAKIADTARKTSNAIKGTNDTLSQSYDTIKRKINELEGVISKSTSIKQIREARRELEQLQRMASRAPGNLSASGSGGGLLRSLIPAISVAGALALGGGALQNGLQAQARQASFEVIAGKEQGTALNKDLTKFAQDSIYGNEVFQNAQTMLGFGIASKDVMANTKMLGDVAMGNAQRLGSLTLAFSQVSAAGKLTGQDLLQFVNAGFNPLQQISKDTGISLAVLKEKVSEGAISFQMVEQAFKNATSEGGMFYNMTNKIAETDFGKWQAFQGQLDALSTQVGGVLAPILGSLITNFLSPLASLISNNIELITFLTTVLAAGAVGYYGYAAAVWAVSAAKTVWAILTGQLTIAQWALNAALTANPIGLVVAAIAALIAGVIYAWNKFEGFRGVLYGVWEVAKMVGQMFVGLGKILIGAMTFDPALLMEGVQQLKSSASSIGESFSKGYDKGVAAFHGSKAKSGSASTSDIKGTTVAGAYGALKSGGANGDEAVKGVTSGGPRVININGVKFTDKIEIHAVTVRESADEIKAIFDEYLLRILNSGAAVQ
ncbi:tape measure protein [Chryseosolibacter indicus]|uniref:Tape measure protein n=1 Tax=Chryseosolibacter indicus TaxID=2782351 RepID=A0ABS5VNC6_9BACT|nr:tape measure protein [Chryseosolibacter indicus]MBT1702960.1 tape measure protein [Chryseosolibacter indicus]